MIIIIIIHCTACFSVDSLNMEDIINSLEDLLQYIPVLSIFIRLCWSKFKS